LFISILFVSIFFLSKYMNVWMPLRRLFSDYFLLQGIKDSCLGAGMNLTLAGFVAGAGGGIAQVLLWPPPNILMTKTVSKTVSHMRNPSQA
jgi:hypothetical protein